MRTIIDLRDKRDDQLIEGIKNLYDEPVEVVSLSEPITPCIGCWNCWLKTPGKCVMKDQMVDHYSNFVNSETVIILMDTAQGFINHQAKAYFDRIIPHYHPYIEMVNGECHHVARYAKYPDMVFFYETKDLTSQEEQVIEDYLYRTAYQFKSKPYRILKTDSLQLRQLESRKPKNRSVDFAATKPMDKLVIYNGSPRRNGSNSTLILTQVLQALGERVEVRDLKDEAKWDQWGEAFKSEEHVMFLMPLYVHAMPSHVMRFMEKLQTSNGSISFFVQSGFPESSQSHYLEAYFELLALRLGRDYLGTAIKGGMESLRKRPAEAQEKMIQPIVKAITGLVKEGKFDTTDIGQLARPVEFGKAVQFLFNLFGKRLVNIYWDQQLKENGAFENRFDGPYQAG